eukprot:CAMPEP_0182424434 /NCGR_PEP_ID=MMETSP1167-20130531/10646_1 /TAXON_ID=2988 /ORGANISM="Mallomonas Sp, Strain CCMP3275" /LENGTH=647 /DNA_ID=CAMNT_0024604251 /DNA_START=212 /DNA_END=2155 /DNA_ORIENTATION=+
MPGNQLSKQFVFDNIYWENNSQESIFQDIGQPVVFNALNGYNCSVFAYGQTGAGKSYTMFGVDDDPVHEGLVPRMCKAILSVKLSSVTRNSSGSVKSSKKGMFEPDSTSTDSEVTPPTPPGLARSLGLGNGMGSSHTSDQFTVKVSYIEIYLERVKDLLAESTYDNKLKVRENPTTGTYVEGARVVEVQSYDELHRLLFEGSRRRAMAVTRMNENSSRSHAVFTICLNQTVVDEYESVGKDSKIHLVDLAGSENQKSTGATGMRQREASYINKSLLTLGRVILALTKNSVMAAKASARENIEKMKTPDVDKDIEGSTGLGHMHPAFADTPTREKYMTMDLRDSDDEEDTTIDCTEHETDTKSRRHDHNGMLPVPYRDSVLTQLLRECIGGNAKTMIIATIRSEMEFGDDTLTTLRFAGMAKKVVNTATVNQQSFTMSTIERLQRQISKLESELAESAIAIRASESDVKVTKIMQTEPTGGSGKIFQSNDSEEVQSVGGSDKHAEIEYLRAAIKELTSQRDCARQVQQLQLQQIEDLRRQALERESKLLEEQRIKEEQIRFLMSIQSKSKAAKEAVRQTQMQESGLDSGGTSESAARLRGQEAFMCLSLKKASSQAARLADEAAKTPVCTTIDAWSSKFLEFYAGNEK